MHIVARAPSEPLEPPEPLAEPLARDISANHATHAWRRPRKSTLARATTSTANGPRTTRAVGSGLHLSPSCRASRFVPMRSVNSGAAIGMRRRRRQRRQRRRPHRKHRRRRRRRRKRQRKRRPQQQRRQRHHCHQHDHHRRQHVHRQVNGSHHCDSHQRVHSQHSDCRCSRQWYRV